MALHPYKPLFRLEERIARYQVIPDMFLYPQKEQSDPNLQELYHWVKLKVLKNKLEGILDLVFLVKPAGTFSGLPESLVTVEGSSNLKEKFFQREIDTWLRPLPAQNTSKAIISKNEISAFESFVQKKTGLFLDELFAADVFKHSPSGGIAYGPKITSKYKELCKEFLKLNESLKRVRVIRDGKPVVKFISTKDRFKVADPDGPGGKPPREVRMTSRELINRRRAARKTAQRGRAQTGAAKTKRARSMRKRDSI